MPLPFPPRNFEEFIILSRLQSLTKKNTFLASTDLNATAQDVARLLLHIKASISFVRAGNRQHLCYELYC